MGWPALGANERKRMSPLARDGRGHGGAPGALEAPFLGQNSKEMQCFITVSEILAPWKRPFCARTARKSQVL